MTYLNLDWLYRVTITTILIYFYIRYYSIAIFFVLYSKLSYSTGEYTPLSLRT